MREKALKLLKQHNKGDYRIFHALSVEAAMRYFAKLRGEDAEYWGAVGLLHDLDFEEHPGNHCGKNPEMLAAAGYDESFIHAVQSHGFNTSTDIKPELFMEKVLYTLNELVSLVSDSALALPSKSIDDLDAGHVVHMFDVDGFAKNANRGIIKKGCAMLEMRLEDVASETIKGMQSASAELGL
jgi:predicted hydrolase (HD superfamily)